MWSAAPHSTFVCRGLRWLIARTQLSHLPFRAARRKGKPPGKQPAAASRRVAGSWFSFPAVNVALFDGNRVLVSSWSYRNKRTQYEIAPRVLSVLLHSSYCPFCLFFATECNRSTSNPNQRSFLGASRLPRTPSVQHVDTSIKTEHTRRSKSLTWVNPTNNSVGSSLSPKISTLSPTFTCSVNATPH